MSAPTIITPDKTGGVPPGGTGRRPRRARGHRPRPPRRPRPAPAPLSKRDQLIRAGLGMVSAVLIGFLVNLTLLGPLRHVAAQEQLRTTFAEQLASGTAPVSEGDFNNVLLSDGDPVARIEIPALGVNEIVAEGTSAAVLAKGPGHRRDGALPGQSGVVVLMGRATAYGGPFGRIQALPPGETISLITGQGEHIYRVTGVRYAGDPAPPAITAGTGRLVLETARGGPFMPGGIVRVDADLVSAVLANGARLTSYTTLPAEDRELASDPTTAWALVFALQFLILAEVGTVWAYRQFGWRKVWAVAVPVVLLSGVLVADQITRLLPNLM